MPEIRPKKVEIVLAPTFSVRQYRNLADAAIRNGAKLSGLKGFPFGSKATANAARSLHVVDADGPAVTAAGEMRLVRCLM